MSDKLKIISIILVVIAIIALSITLVGIEKQTDKGIENEIYVSELVEDECTQEYEEIQKATVVSVAEEKLSANAILILKKYYEQCDHTINEYVELPQELVNLTEKEVQAEFVDWEVIGFEKGKLTLYKEYKDFCGEHFKLKIEDGKVVIYIINNDGTETIYEKTNISSEYLTETDLLNMQDGLEIYGREELNQIIEDFE